MWSLLKNMKKENSYSLLAALFTFLFYMLRICKTIDINISFDEIGTFASASALAGNDWSGMLPLTRYYGYGFYWIFAGLFYITDDPYLIYITIYVVDCLILSLTAILIYKIEIHELFLPNNVATLFFAMFPGLIYSIVNYAYLTNDVMVYTVFWIIIFLLLRLFNEIDDKTRNKYSVLLAFHICYILTIHERAIVVFGGVIILLILWKWIIKKRIVNEKIFLVSVICFYLLARITKKLVILLFWSDIEADTLANTSAIYSDLFWYKNLQEFKVIIDILVANIIKTGISSYGVFFLAIIVSVRAAITVLKKKGRLKEVFGQKLLLEKCTFIFIFSMAAIVITMLGVAVQWGNGVWDKIELGIELGNSLRAYAYLRYYITYIGPILLVIYRFCLNMIFEKQLYWYVYTMIGLLGYYYLTEVDVYLGRQKNIMEIVNIFNDQIWNRHLSMLIVTLFVFLLSGFGKKSNRTIYIIMCGFLMLYSYLPSDLGKPRLMSSRCGATYQYITEINDKKSLEDGLFVLDNGGCYQFFLNRYTLKMWNNEQQGLVLAHSSIEKICENQILCAQYDVDLLKSSECLQLDENEYLYILGNHKN